MASSGTATKAPPDARTARERLPPVAGVADADAVGDRLGGTGHEVAAGGEGVDQRPRPRRLHAEQPRQPVTKPRAFISTRPFPIPAIVQPSPTDTATQSGISSPHCSAISSPPVFFPSTSDGFTAALRLYQP